MDPVSGPSAPKETRPLILPFDISEVATQLQDATIRWDGSGPVEVELRGPNDRVVLFFSPICFGGSCSILIQARLASDRSVALSLEKVNLYAVLLSSEEQEPIFARREAHALSLSDIAPGVTYLLQIGNPPTVARGSNSGLPANDGVDVGDTGLWDCLIPPPSRGRSRREELVAV